MKDGCEIFISHAVEDKNIAITLEQFIWHFSKKKIRTFFSSSTEGLQVGDEWLNKIKENLDVSNMLILLLGPSTKSKEWLHFEAGAAWIKGKEIIIICHSGLDVSEIPSNLKHIQAAKFPSENFGSKLFSKISDIFKLEMSKATDFGDFENELERSAELNYGPRECVENWNNYLREGNEEKARFLTHSRGVKDIEKFWPGGFTALIERYKNGRESFSVYESPVIHGDVAKVKYTVYYFDESFSVMEWEDLVVLENEEWKILPQFFFDHDKTPDRRRIVGEAEQE